MSKGHLPSYVYFEDILLIFCPLEKRMKLASLLPFPIWYKN